MGNYPASMSMWVPHGLNVGYMGTQWAWLELGKFCGSHMVSVKWTPHVKPMWADCMSPIRDVSGLSRHGHKLGKMYGPHIISETWAPHVKPIWAG